MKKQSDFDLTFVYYSNTRPSLPDLKKIFYGKGDSGSAVFVIVTDLFLWGLGYKHLNQTIGLGGEIHQGISSSKIDHILD